MLNNSQTTVAIIDSGLGGLSILKQLMSKFKVGNYLYYADNLYMPYGSKSKAFVANRVKNIINELNLKYHIDFFIIGCNTASTSLNENMFSNVLTLKFDTTKTYLTTNLTKKNKSNINCIAVKNLAPLIEKYILNPNKLKTTIKQKVNKLGINKLKHIVLGCTHYELAKNIFNELCPNTIIENNSKQIINQVTIQGEELNLYVILSKESQRYRKTIERVIRQKD